MTETSLSASPATLSATDDEDIWESIPEVNRHKAEEFTPSCCEILRKLGHLA